VAWRRRSHGDGDGHDALLRHRHPLHRWIMSARRGRGHRCRHRQRRPAARPGSGMRAAVRVAQARAALARGDADTSAVR
jgi:hypothetical protein